MAKRSPTAATEILSYDREARAIEMRAQGESFQSIATTLGYSDASGASKAYHRALKRRPAQNVDEIRAQEGERLEYLWRKTSEVIENPPPAHSAIGKIVIDTRTGEPVLDQSVKIRAITEYRHLSESYRKMCGVDITAKALEQDPLQLPWWQDFEARYTAKCQEAFDLRQECDRLRLELASLENTVPAEVVDLASSLVNYGRA